ncbi:hypothetical protein FCT18_21065 [Lysinibacillus sphaericus]|uniref:Uncharacterized protein n=1 Tax=Lysinibacillus sphaericus TaxID=1421 RepID=A0A2S0K065_LYSSH|nr:hypothetical protein [Lysinibacillus sphaericus]AVK96698.1 hypothetical protein LS41612_10685 [Lysinibacillus sphaericus]MED4543049.1 hypothetical protein [Lysinibacillus sphaericus]TKI16409.1 hypothetical protein FCT18_21065 [Lysinibacillus sphaericus]SUV17488.1 Uncharacterised protein [Lysinibacillus sphaericus]GEC83951.1 hypothetical protein LSP03_36940 [Lysinibacillus sphaericus]
MRYNKSIDCGCGHKVNLDDFLNLVRNEALDDGEISDLQEEITCNVCNAIYQVSASAYVHVDVSLERVELLSRGFVLNGETVSLNQFGIGEEVALQMANTKLVTCFTRLVVE